MKFLCLCHYEQARFDAWTPAEVEAIGKACQPHDAALHRSGKVPLVCSLGLPAMARTIRPTDAGPVVTDGPFADSPEPWGACFIVEAADLDEAVRVASLHPGAHLGRWFGGGIEVRPIDQFEFESFTTE